jgi:hypothetical protein
MRAEWLLNDALARLREISLGGGAAEVLLSLGRVARHRGEHERAQELYAESVLLAQTDGPAWIVSAGLEGLAEVWEAQGQVEGAARLLGGARALRERDGTAIRPADRPQYERLVERVQAALHPEAFERAWEEGRTMSLEEVLTSRLAE